MSAIERDPGFKDLLRETETVVLECRKLLKSQAMKCTEEKVAALKDKVTGDYAKALPTMAQLLIAQEGIKNAKKHDVVSDLLRHNRDEAISFSNISDPDFKKIYCEVNGIYDIPSHSVPPLFDHPVVAPTPTQGVLNTRRGGIRNDRSSSTRCKCSSSSSTTNT